MERDKQRTAVETPLPVRSPNVADPAPTQQEVLSSTLEWRLNSAEYRELLKWTRDGLLALNESAGVLVQPTPEDGERLQREVDGVIARWKAHRLGARRAG